MKITPGTSGLAQNIQARAKSTSKGGKVIKLVNMPGCAHNEY